MNTERRQIARQLGNDWLRRAENNPIGGSVDALAAGVLVIELIDEVETLRDAVHRLTLERDSERATNAALPAQSETPVSP